MITRKEDKNGEMALIRNREKDLKIRQDFLSKSWKDTIPGKLFMIYRKS